MGIYRTNQYSAEITATLDSLNGKVVKADSDHTYTHSPLEAAMESDKVATFSYLASVASGDSTNVYLSNPSDNGVAKFAIFIDTTDQGQINVYYDPDVDTSSATALTPKPVLVGQDVNVSVSAYAGVTINSSTPDIQRTIPGGNGRLAQGNTSEGLPGFGLLPGHSIAIEVVNGSNNSNTVSFLIIYWED